MVTNIDTALATMEYEGYSYSLRASSLKFLVDFKGELNREPESFGTAQQAMAAIDQHRQAFAKSRRLSLRVITALRNGSGVELNREQITGVNLATGRFTGLGTEVDRKEVYVDEIWVIDALRERAELQKQVTALTQKLDAVKLSSRSRTNVDKYAETLDAIEVEYTRKLAVAQEGSDAAL